MLTHKICFALARPSTRRPPAANSNATSMVREQINKPCLFSRLRVNAQGLGLKRSVTTLRGGTLGYAEIVALKVNRPPPPRKARHASWCRDPDGRPPIPPIASPLFLTRHLVIVQHCRSRRRFFSSSFHPHPLSRSPLSTFPYRPCYTTCMSVFLLCPRRRIHPGCSTGRISSLFSLVVASYGAFGVAFSRWFIRNEARRRCSIVESGSLLSPLIIDPSVPI